MVRTSIPVEKAVLLSRLRGGLKMKTHIRLNIIFRRGNTTINTIVGQRDIPLEELTAGDIVRLTEIEQTLERLTGIRCHIEQAE